MTIDIFLFYRGTKPFHMYGMMVIMTLVDLILKEKVNAFFKKENMLSPFKFQIQIQLIEQSLIKHYSVLAILII